MINLFRRRAPDVYWPNRAASQTTPPRHQTPLSRHRQLPETETGWMDRYNWLWRWYTGEPYDEIDYEALRLWRATDDVGDIMQITSRMSLDASFVVDTNVRALAGRRWSLQSAPMGQLNLRAGEAVWRRAGLQAHRSEWMRTLAALGDVHLHAALNADGRGTIVAYDPRHVHTEYAVDGKLRSAHVRIPYFGADDGKGNRPLNIYHRVVTANDIEAWEETEDGGRMPLPESGRNPLGVVPWVHLRYDGVTGFYEHGRSAMSGLELPLAAVDSMMAHIQAISQRYASPHVVFDGVDPGSDDPSMFGRNLIIPPGGNVRYLEAGMGALAPLWQIVHEYLSDVRGTIPEFTLAGSGANTSGRALEFRADQFRRKAGDIQARVWEGVAWVTEYAVAMESGARIADDEPGYRVVGPPPLPMDDEARTRIVQAALSAGIMKPVDGVRALQAIGVLDEEIDAVSYARDLAPPAQRATPEPVTIEEDTDGE